MLVGHVYFGFSGNPHRRLRLLGSLPILAIGGEVCLLGCPYFGWGGSLALHCHSNCSLRKFPYMVAYNNATTLASRRMGIHVMLRAEAAHTHG